MVTPVSANGALNPEPTPAAEMAAILGNILKKHGKAVLEDRRRTLGLLHDYAPGEARCVRLLMSAYDADVPKNLMAEDGAPNELKLEQEASSLVANSGLQVELARWAVSVWSSALTGMLPAGVAAAQAESAPAAPMAPSANDLTWDDTAPASPSTAAATPAAPSVAPSYAPAPSVAPTAETNTSSLLQKPIVRYGLAAAGLIVAIVSLTSHMDSPGPAAPAPHNQPQPATPAPQHQPQPAAPAPRHEARPATNPAPAAATNVQVASLSNNVKDWPKFAGATHPNNNPNDWRFRFNVRSDDGRVMIYAVNVAMSSNEQSGTGTVRALDYRYVNRAAQMLSSTPSVTVSRIQEPKTKVYFTRIATAAWAKNPSQAPKVCVVFSSGRELQRFSPDNGMFCAFDVQGNKCGHKLGCGRL